MHTSDTKNTGQLRPPLFTGDFLLLLISGLLLTTGIGVFYLFPLFVLELGGDKSDIGMLMGAMSLSAVLGRPWISFLVDRIGRKNSLKISCLLMVVVSLSHLFFKGPIDQVFAVLLALRLLYGTGLSLGIVAALTMATDLTPVSRLNQGIGIFGVMPLLGIAIGPVVAEFLVAMWGFDAMFYAAAAFSIGAILFLMPLEERFTSSGGSALGSFLNTLHIPQVWRMAVICLCFGVAFAAHGSFVAPFAELNGLSISAYFAAYSAAAIIARVFGGNLADRFGETRLIPMALITAGIGFVCLVKVTTTGGLAATGFVAGWGHGLLFPSLIALTIRPIAAGSRGKVTGILTGGVDSGMFMGAITMGQLGEHFGFGAIFATAAITIFLGLIIFYWIRPVVSGRPSSGSEF